MTMQTKLLDAKEIEEAATLLCSGQLVGIPTETVYGLAADALNPQAVEAIFRAKGRPQDNPLILHIADTTWLERYCAEIPQAAYRLAEAFWPGPLTMILKRKAVVPNVVTANLETVGIRCPAHSLCRQLIASADIALAAPSGNISGKPSPTTAEAMLGDMYGKIPAILNGGSCHVGVESTIVDLTGETPQLLRPGGISLEQLREILGEVAVDDAIIKPIDAAAKPRAPGMKYRHYAPEAPVIVVGGTPEKAAAYIMEQAVAGDGVICFEEFCTQFPKQLVRSLGSYADQAEHGRRIFEALRYFDDTSAQKIYAQCPPADGIGMAVANRLKKAAGFHVIEVDS